MPSYVDPRKHIFRGISLLIPAGFAHLSINQFEEIHLINRLKSSTTDEMDTEPTMLMQSQQHRSKEELTSLLAERLARKKALNSAIYVDSSVSPSIDVSTDAASKTNRTNSKGLMICISLNINKPPAAFFDEAREEVTAALHDMFHRYNPASSAYSNSRSDNKSEDDSAREGAEETPDDNNPNQDVRNWISVAAAQNPDVASLLTYVPSPRSNNSNNSRTLTSDTAVTESLPTAAHRRSISNASYTSSVSCASSATDSTLSSPQAPDMLDEMEWWIPGFDKDRFQTLVDELKQQDEVKEEEEMEENSSDAGKTFSITEESTSGKDERLQCESTMGTKLEARTLSLTEESLTDVFEGLECEITTTTDQEDATNQYGTFSLTESITSPGNTFDSAVGCAQTEEMDNTIDQERSAAADTVGHSSILAYYERVVQAPTTSDGSGSNNGTSNDGHQTATVITESHAPNDGGIAIECKFDQETAVGAAPDAADDAVNWEAEVIEARRVDQELQDQLQKMLECKVSELEEKKRIDDEQDESSKAAPNKEEETKQEEDPIEKEEEDEKVADVKRGLRAPAGLKKFTPKSTKAVTSSISKLKSTFGRKKKSNPAEEPKGKYNRQ